MALWTEDPANTSAVISGCDLEETKHCQCTFW